MENRDAQGNGRMTKREIAIVAGAGLVLAIAASWPLALHLSDSFPALGFGDPYLFSWQIAWDGHALVTDPLNVLDANTFWPEPNDLLFQDAFHGFSPLALIGDGAVAAVIRYNLVYLFAGMLAFVGTYLLARELGLGIVGATAAGIAFAYAPWRIDQHTHIHVISSGGIPLSLFLLLRGYKRGRAGFVLGGWLVATWQMSLGFTLGIQFSYLLATLALVWFVWWLRSGRPKIPAPIGRATAIGVLVFVGWTIFQALPYVQIQGRFPEARRSIEHVRFFSPPLAGLAAAAEHNLVWGEPTEGIREKLVWPTEQSLFPGLASIALATAGIRFGAMRRSWRTALLASSLVAGFLSLGMGTAASARVYEVIFNIAPGWDAIRTPGRLMTLATLGLAVLAGAGLQRLWNARASFRSAQARGIGTVAVIILAAFLWLEGVAREPLSAVPPVPSAQGAAVPPILHLPTDEIHDRVYTYWSTQGFPEILNGIGVINPRVNEMRAIVGGFPDEPSLTFLRDIGARTVIVHLDRLDDPATWLDAARTRATQLRLSERIVGSAIVFDLGGV